MIIRQRTGVVLLLSAVALATVSVVMNRTPNGPGRARFPWDGPRVERDLDVITTDTLRMLVLPDPLSWEVRPRATTGLEYELLERFARKQGLVLVAIPVQHPDSMWMALQTGKGDIIAAQYAPRPEQEDWASTTSPYYRVLPMCARLRDDHLLTKVGGDRPDTVYISQWSPFIGMHPGGKPGAEAPLAQVAGAMPEELLMDVVLGKRGSVVVTDAIASHEAQRLPALEFTPLQGPERALSFVVRSNAPKLLAALDAWLAQPDEIVFRTALIDSYLGRLPKAGALRKRSMPASADSISPYDPEFRHHGQGFGWKWQLLAAMAWKESRFDSAAVSHMGAHGIMQLMPRTAAHFGVDSSVVVGDHIKAAKRYITRLDTMWMRAVPDRDQRLRFVLASYNAGLGHIIDAQRLAEQLGLDPKRWEHNVERAVILLAKPRYYQRPEMKNGYCKGSQVFHYVRDVVALYNQLIGLPAGLPAHPITPGPEEHGASSYGPSEAIP